MKLLGVMDMPDQYSDDDGEPQEFEPGPSTIPKAGVGPEAPVKKRRRPPLACEQCRRRKIRCDKSVPCDQCTKAGLPTCSYAEAHIPRSWTKNKQRANNRHPPTTSTSSIHAGPHVILPAPPSSHRFMQKADTEVPLAASLPPSSPSSPSSARKPFPESPTDLNGPIDRNNIGWLVTRIHNLEEKLYRAENARGGEDPGGNNASPQDNRGDSSSGSSHPSTKITKITTSRTKYFGRSHWMNGINLFPLTMKLLNQDPDESNLLSDTLSRCKVLGRAIKRHRLKPISSLDIGHTIPTRELADQLVEAYLRTFEGVIRILHIPLFHENYEAYWRDPSSASEPFIIQMQLAMALGALFHDSTFSMRAQATQWIYEAQVWLLLPPGKNRLTMAGIQAMCLLALARTVCGVDPDLVWITAGALVRTAIYIGLHRDPSHLGNNMTTFRAEMRRRLWFTVEEINLQLAFDAGAPPLISNIDHDVRTPSNLDDAQLDDGLDRERTTKFSGSFSSFSSSSPSAAEPVTQMSVPLELIRCLPLRLNLLRHINDFRSGEHYDQTLRFNSELTKICRRMSRSVSALVHDQEDKPCPIVTTFHSSVAELFVYRCFHTLHQPVVSLSLDDPKFFFSRKMHLDGALKIMHLCGLSGSRRSNGPGRPEDTITMDQDAPPQTDLDRLIINGSGTYRNLLMQSMPSLVIEMLHGWDVSANDGGGGGGGGPTTKKADPHAHLGTLLGYLPAVDDYDLRATLEACVLWSLRRIRSGETNVKCHCFTSACLAHVDAVAAGMDQKSFEAEIQKSAEAAALRAIEALKAAGEREGVTETGSGPSSVGIGESDRSVEDLIATDIMGGDWTWDVAPGVFWGAPQPTGPVFDNGIPFDFLQ